MNKQKIIPQLRFPEFLNEGEWVEEFFYNLCVVLKDGDWIEIKDQSSSGVRLVQTGNIGIGEFLKKQQNARYISEETFDLLNCTEIFQGDCLISRLPEPIGRSCIIPVTNERMITSVDCLIVRFDKNKITPYLFILYSQTDYYIKEVNALASGSTRVRISKENLIRLKIPIPKSLSEQQKIADCLSSLDEVIEGEKQRLEQLKRHKKALLQNLFPQQGEKVPKLRFPEFADSGEWEEKTLGEVADFVNEKTQIDHVKINSYISTENILPLYGGITNVTKLPFSGNFTKYQEEDILFSNIRPYLKKVWFSNMKGACSNDVIVIRSKSKIKSNFLSYILMNDSFIGYIMKNAEGVKMPRGDKDSIKKYIITFPLERKEQEKIAHCLSSLDETIQNQTERIKQLKKHKKGLLQNLFPRMRG